MRRFIHKHVQLLRPIVPQGVSTVLVIYEGYYEGYNYYAIIIFGRTHRTPTRCAQETWTFAETHITHDRMYRRDFPAGTTQILNHWGKVECQWIA